MSDKATDLRPPFFIVEDSAVTDYDLNAYEGWLYIVILRHANRKTGEAFPSVSTLAKETRMSKASVIRYTKTLEAKGLIRVTRDEKKNGKDREVNHYWILSATPVSDSNRGSVSQTPDPVSVSNMNQSHFEPEKDSPDGVAPSKPAKPKKERPPHKNAPWHDELLRCFGLSPETVTATGDRTYWVAAADLAKINFPVERIEPFYQWCDAQGWKDFTVMALAKHAGEWLAGNKDDDDPFADMFSHLELL